MWRQVTCWIIRYQKGYPQIFFKQYQFNGYYRKHHLNSTTLTKKIQTDKMPDQVKTEKTAEVFCFSIWHRDFTEFKKPAYNMRGFQKGSFLRIVGGRQPSAHTSAGLFAHSQREFADAKARFQTLAVKKFAAKKHNLQNSGANVSEYVKKLRQFRSACFLNVLGFVVFILFSTVRRRSARKLYSPPVRVKIVPKLFFWVLGHSPLWHVNWDSISNQCIYLHQT